LAVKIRLSRMGRKNVSRFRIVASDSRNARDGRFLEVLGYYNPQATQRNLKLTLNVLLTGYKRVL